MVRVVSRSAYSGGNRSFAMRRLRSNPSAFTFSIKPIRHIVNQYVRGGAGWADPFAGENSPAELTNDLNPERPSKYHMDAFEFAKILPDELEGILFDPPYSWHQVVEMYEGFGLRKQAQVIKDVLAPKVRMGGLAICCGWNTNGFGRKRGFDLVEVLVVAHGGDRNDTLVTVERKMRQQERLPL